MRTPVPTTRPITPEARAAADSLAALPRPASDSGAQLPDFAAVRALELSVTDLFCGLGGSSLGAAWAGAVPVLGLNHWPTAVDSYRANHTGGVEVDLQDSSAWAHPATRALIAAPDHTGPQRAAGGAQQNAELRSRNAAWYASRSRATARRVAEFAEAHGYRARGDDGYQFIVVESLVEFATGGWPYLRSWLADFSVSGYRPTFYSIDAAHAGAAASRERLFVVFTRTDRPLPDPVLRVRARCRTHGEVLAPQRWLAGERTHWVGKYGQDYLWACPACGQQSTPVAGGAVTAVDLTRSARPISDRVAGKTLSAETVARIHAGVDRHGPAPLIVQTTRTFRPGKPLTEPLPTLTTRQELGVWQPAPDGDFTRSTFRYLQPDELAAAAGFPTGYAIRGTKIRDQVRQIGQAVTPSLAADLVARAAATLL